MILMLQPSKPRKSPQLESGTVLFYHLEPCCCLGTLDEHGNLRNILKGGGFASFFVCRAMVRARMAMCRTAIESRASGLTPESKIMSKLLGTVKIHPLKVKNPSEK